MKYYVKYPTAKVGFAGERMKRIETVYSCWNCGTPTSWIDTEMGEAICSTECRHRMHLIVGKGKTKFLEENDDVGDTNFGICI